VSTVIEPRHVTLTLKYFLLDVIFGAMPNDLLKDLFLSCCYCTVY